MLFSPSIKNSLFPSLHSRNLRFIVYLVLYSTILISTRARAIELTPAGPGGGGWLFAGTFDPDDSRTMMIGTDMCGVFRTKNSGQNWKPWNNGLLTDRPTALDQISYVQDLLVIRRNGGAAENFAATLGGIFKSVDEGPWQRDTSGIKYLHSYEKYTLTDTIPIINASIPFSCFAYNGGDVLYAGAGSNRVGYLYADHWYGTELEAYPGLEDYTRCSNFQYCKLVSSYHDNKQYTVWIRDLNSSANDAWEPLMEIGNQHGVARDITAATINEVNYVVVSTLHGIWMYTDHGTYWSETELSTNPLYDDNSNLSTTYYGNMLLCWNVYLTNRGVLYASMHLYDANDQPIIPGGVYRLFVVPIESGEEGKWYWVGNEEDLDNGEGTPPGFLERTMGEVGRDTRGVTCGSNSSFQTGSTIWLMNVIEGMNAEPDIILLGSRISSQYSLIRGVQPYAAQSNINGRASWGCRVYRNGGVDYMYEDPGDPGVALDVGYQDFWGASVIFQPVVFKPNQSGGLDQDETPALVQFNSMVHRSDDAGMTWSNVYCSGSPGMWSGRGYDEMEVHDIDFYSNGNVIEAAQDVGIFTSSNIIHSIWSRENTPVDPGRSGTGVDAWSDGSNETIMATIGFKEENDDLVMKLPDGSWVTVPLSVGEHQVLGIHDIELTSHTVCFVAYSYRVDANNRSFGVMRGLNSGGNNWTWTSINNDPLLTMTTEELLATGCTMELEFMPAINRLFCSIGFSPNLYMLASPTDNNWITLPRPWGSSITYSGYNIYDMASSSINNRHSLVFALSEVSPSQNYPSVVYRTENADASPGNILWDEFQLPVVLSANDAHILKAVTISPYDDHAIYFGINVKGSALKEMINIHSLHQNTGLWRLDIEGYPGQWTHTWTYEFSQTMAEGIVVEDIAFNPFVQGQLVIATGGQGLYYSQIPPPSEPVTAKYVNKSTSVYGLDYAGIPYSMITLDYDNDGRQDLLVTQQNGRPRLYRNEYNGANGVPRFDNSISAFDALINDLSSARGASAADYDNDGNIDLFIAHEIHPMLLRNLGVGNSPRFMNDGHVLDYIVTTIVGQDTIYEPHNALETSWAGSWGEMNNDGRIDLLVTRADAPGATKLQRTHIHQPFVPLLNQSESGQTAFGMMQMMFGSYGPAQITSSSVSWSDIDNDGWLDLLLPSLGDPADTRLYHRTAQPTYTDEFTVRFPGVELGDVDAAVWADLNRDGLPDLITTERNTPSSSGRGIRLFMNDPANPGNFSECTAWSDTTGPTTDLRPIDFDLDGWIDLVTVADLTTDQPGIRLLRNTGGVGLPGGFPYFQDVSSDVGLANDNERVSGMAAADFLADGDIDLLLGRDRGNNTFYYSATAPDGVTEPPSSHWLGVRLNVESEANNRSGIGAVVTVQAGDASTTQVVDGGSGLGGQQSTSLRFGLGDYTENVDVQIRWPGGFVQLNSPTTVDTVITLEDQTDPMVIETSLNVIVYYIPNKTLTWILTWDTAHSYAVDMERVLITVPSIGTISYAPGDENVSASSGVNINGGYWHRFQINNVPCLDGYYPYTVISDTHSPQYTEHTTASGIFTTNFCAKGGGEPNVEE